MLKISFTWIIIPAALFAGASIGYAGDTSGQKSLGEQTYFTYCALCHGIGAGPGMFADALKKAAPDLTEIAKRNGGQFPNEKVAAIIRDGGISGHGTMRLLSWERYFQRDNSETEAEHIVQELTSYLRAHQAN